MLRIGMVLTLLSRTLGRMLYLAEIFASSPSAKKDSRETPRERKEDRTSNDVIEAVESACPRVGIKQQVAEKSDINAAAVYNYSCRTLQAAAVRGRLKVVERLRMAGTRDRKL